MQISLCLSPLSPFFYLFLDPCLAISLSRRAFQRKNDRLASFSALYFSGIRSGPRAEGEVLRTLPSIYVARFRFRSAYRPSIILIQNIFLFTGMHRSVT